MRCDQNTAAKGYRPEGKVVNLLEYRRWLALEQALDWEETAAQGERVPEETQVPEVIMSEYVPAPRPLRRRSRHRRRSMRLDLWACAAAAVLALALMVRVLFF